MHKIFASNINKTTDKVGMFAHNYNSLFTSILRNYANDINIKYKKGFNLADYSPKIVNMLSSIVKNSTISPFVQDEMLFAGFSMQEDLP